RSAHDQSRHSVIFAPNVATRSARYVYATFGRSAMFSLQTILGRKDQIHELLQASSGAALDAARAADRLTHDSDSALSVATFTAARRREKELAMQISEALINTFVTSLDREDVEAINSALYRIPKILERFADRYVLVHEELVGID